MLCGKPRPLARLGDQGRVAWRWVMLAWVAEARGDLVRAEASGHEALQRFRDLKIPEGIAEALRRLGSVARHRGDLEQAAACLEEGLALDEELGLLGSGGRSGPSCSATCCGNAGIWPRPARSANGAGRFPRISDMERTNR